MRYITVPGPFDITDAIEEKPIEGVESFSFAKFVRVLTSNAAAEQAADTLTLYEIRADVAKTTSGCTWKVSDEWYEILKKQAVRLKGVTPSFAFSAVPHVKAIVNAKDEPSLAATTQA